MVPPGLSSGGRLDAAQQPGLDLLTLRSPQQSWPCLADPRTATPPPTPGTPPTLPTCPGQTCRPWLSRVSALPLTACSCEFEGDLHVLLTYSSITDCTSSSLAKPPVCLRPA